MLAYPRDTSSYTNGSSLEGEEVSISSAVIQGQDKHLTAFVDSDWANDPEDYISVTGFVVYLGTSPVSWTAKKQKLVTLSSTEAEFIALCDVTREILWIQPLVESFKIKGVKENTVIHDDNLPAINLVHNEQTKRKDKAFIYKDEICAAKSSIGKYTSRAYFKRE